MNLNRFRAQKLAVKYGILLGVLFLAINCVVTFFYLDAISTKIVSYLTVPLIIFFSSILASQRMKQTKEIAYAIQSCILMVCIALVIGFGSLFLLVYYFIDIVKNNPVILQQFQASGQTDINTFIKNKQIYAATTAIPVSIILGIISATFGSLKR